MRLAMFRWLRTKLAETRLHIPVDVRYVGRGPGGGLIATLDCPPAMLVRRVVLCSTPEPRVTRRWQIGSLTIDWSLVLPWRWHLNNCGMAELRAGQMSLMVHPVPVAFFGPNAPGMIRGVVLKGPMHIQVTVAGLAGLVRLFAGGRIMAEVEGRMAPDKARAPGPGIELLRSIVEPAP